MDNKFICELRIPSFILLCILSLVFTVSVAVGETDNFAATGTNIATSSQPRSQSKKLKPYELLHHAVYSCNAGELESVLAKGIDANVADSYGNTAILTAAARCNPDVLKLLLDSGTDPNSRTKKQYNLNGTPIFEGTTPILAASANGRTENVKLLIQRGADVNAVTINSITALLAATAFRHNDIVEILLINGADPNIQTISDYVDQGLDVFKGNTILEAAAFANDTKIVRLLIAHGAKINASDRNGITPLYIAAWHGNTDIVEHLLKKGADPNPAILHKYFQKGVPTYEGTTPLIIAAYRDHKPIVRLLLQHGANVNDKTAEGASALIGASAMNHMDIVEMLLDAGAEPNASVLHRFEAEGGTVLEGTTALLAAAFYGRTQVAELLIDHGADIDAQDKVYGYGALHIAALEGHADLVRMLIQKGANIYLKDKYGQDLPYISKFIENDEIVQLIEHASHTKEQ